MQADELRRAFVGFFESRDHVVVPSASLIPHDPSLLFTVAGMVPFKPYFVGDEPPPWPRAVSIQKCVRAGGKHNDLDEIGRTSRHLTFFEMMGNFSFGDYFKAEAIASAWEFFTEVLGLDAGRLWVTVHLDDDEAAEIWHDQEEVPSDRIQRFDEDNFWKMADTGPCGPCSEIFWDKGDQHGAGGGPQHGDEDRFVEIWNLVFMEFDQAADGSRSPLPKPSIDTGSGLERVLGVLQGADSVFELDAMRPLIADAERITDTPYGGGGEDDVSLRIVADHARTFTHLVSDGVVPSNEDRGYVLRSIIRRAVQRTWMLGLEDGIVTVPMAGAVIDQMGGAYPELIANRDFICETVEREEGRFRQTLRSGIAILDDALGTIGRDATLPGPVAFKLHDTFGFPIQLTTEIAASRGQGVDRAGFDEAMADQRERARAARKASSDGEDRTETYREILESHGASDFVGYDSTEVDATITEVIQVGGDEDDASSTVEVFCDRTPFYAEAGGQVGDTGVIETATGHVVVDDTTYALPGLHRHRGRIARGEVAPGPARLMVDAERRDGIRRHHTATHLLHWALREVLGGHVKQAGSIVLPDRLRFDFSHHSPVGADQLRSIEALANVEVLTNEAVVTEETSKADADRRGVIAFFGDKYGETVRVLAAGRNSLELCGGTHVASLGAIGPIKIVSESSIGANTRRLEAVAGRQALELISQEEDLLARAADLLGAPPDQLIDALGRRLDELDVLRREIKDLRTVAATGDAGALAAEAVDGVVVARRDGLDQKTMRDLAAKVRDHDGVNAVVIGGVSDPAKGKVALVSAVRPDTGLVASDLLADAARLVGGGAGGGEEMANAGGKNPEALDDALDSARAAATA
ncbi:MAG TPA: alanine--tRNA ligase [Acidimicrobiales bacterium]|jgi:alanyl-tRNA synthetase